MALSNKGQQLRSARSGYWSASSTWRVLVFTVLLDCCAASAVGAELKDCNGTWSNRPCAEITVEQPQHLSKAGAVSAPQEAEVIEREQRRKSSRFFDFDSRIFNARRAFEIDFDTAPIKEYCMSQATTFAQCSQRIDEAEDRLDAKILAVKTLRTQQRANEIQAKRNTLDASGPDTQVIVQQSITVQQNQVEIENNDPTIIVGQHRRRRDVTRGGITAVNPGSHSGLNPRVGAAPQSGQVSPIAGLSVRQAARAAEKQGGNAANNAPAAASGGARLGR